jgi:AcrR family transcriptional regulator
MPAKSREEVVAAATQVFARYGFRRTTMGDLAEAAGMSRPALYLVYPSKAELFSAVIARRLEEALIEIREGVARLATPREKLTFAFDVWSVRPFERVRSSPDARDLYQGTGLLASARSALLADGRAAEVTSRATDELVSLIAGVLAPLTKRHGRAAPSATGLARLLVSAVPGSRPPRRRASSCAS